MKFSVFSNYLQRLETISSRLEMTSVLSELFQNLEKEEIPQACYLLQGELLPAYQSLELQIAVKTVLKALARIKEKGKENSKENSEVSLDSLKSINLLGEEDYSQREEEVERLYKTLGDLGKVAEEVSQSTSVTDHETILSVYESLCDLAKDTGAQSQQRKLSTLVEILKKLNPISTKFVVRIILGRLRLGFSDMTMIDALSWAMTGGKSERDLLEDAYQKKADIGKLAQFYLSQKDETSRKKALAEYHLEVGVPVIPALCQRLNTAAEMIEKMHDVIAEPKYDGLRVQIHINKKESFFTLQENTSQLNPHIKTFTRNLEETSHMFPELHGALSFLNCDTCILDAEAIGYDPQTGDLLPFQQTIQRKRKHDISEKAKDIPIRFYVFDALHINGEDLIHLPLLERKQKLYQLFKNNDILYHSPTLRTTDPVELHHYHEQNLAEGLEGIVVKQADADYQSGRKGWSWVKIKETEGSSGKLADTLDVVVMGYYAGRGKRAEFGIGAILVGVMDEETGEVKTIAKIGTGLTDEVLRQTKQKCDELQVKEQPKMYVVHKMLVPDVWCRPEFVVEVAADEVTNSPLHSAEVALRFPRLVKFRDDKNWEQITTLKELKQMTK
jgi:DNA ligase-1